MSAPTVSFAKPNAEPQPVTAEVVTPNTNVTLVPVGAMPVARVRYEDDGDIDFSEVKIPRINIVQKVGELSNNFPPGEITLNQAISIHNPKTDKPLELTIVGFRPSQYTEKLPGGKLGLLCDTTQEVAANNGTLDYKAWKSSIASGKPLRYFQTLCTALCIIRKPDNFVDDETAPNFPYEFEGNRYALVLWGMKGTAFTHGAKVFKTARRMGHLRSVKDENGNPVGGGYTSGSWNVTTELVDKEGNFYYQPLVEANAKNTEAFQNFILDVLGER